MKYIKPFENFNDQDIHSICEKYGIENYTINDDGSIDVDGNVYLYGRSGWRNYRGKLNKLPLKFRNITGNFDCSHNELTSFDGCPISVGGSFFCNNNKLINLKGCPESVGGDFYCSYNKLTSLEGCPESVGGGFYCNDNKISDFIGFIEPIGNFECRYNPINNIWRLFENKEHVELLNDYDCIRGENIVIDRLNMFLEEIDKPTVQNVKGYNNI